MTQRFFYRNTFFLVMGALALNFFFFSFNRNTLFFDGLLLPHAEIAYNVYAYNSIKVNPQRLADVESYQRRYRAVLEYQDIDHAGSGYGEPTAFRSINDTIGYGVLMGVIWKLTGALRYWPIQLLQIILFSLLMILIYQCALLMFNNETIALLSGIFLLLFTPLIYLNVQTMRDIWAYYAAVLMLYAVLAYFHDRMSLRMVFTIGSLIAVCQHIRPTSVMTLLCMSAAIFFLYRQHAKKVFLFMAIVWSTNIALFWIPFMAYNSIAYGRVLVAPAGQDLYEGLGEFANDKGLDMNDDTFANMMNKQYGLKLGTTACDDKAKELFWCAVQKDPWFYVTCLIKRLRYLVCFNPLWTNGVDDLFKATRSFKERVMVMLHHPLASLMKLIDGITVKLHYVELYLFIGWLGFLLLLWRGLYVPAVLLMSIALSCVAKFPSHLEPRYLVTCYWVFAFFVAYAVWNCTTFLRKKIYER